MGSYLLPTSQAQLVEQSTGIAEFVGLNPVVALILFIYLFIYLFFQAKKQLFKLLRTPKIIPLTLKKE